MSTVCSVKQASLQLDPVKPKLDTLFPLPTHTAQGEQAKDATKAQLWETSTKCLNSHTRTWLVYIATLCIGAQRGADSHGGYLQLWPRCLGHAL